MNETEMPEQRAAIECKKFIDRLREEGMSEFVDVLLTRQDCYDENGRLRVGVLAGYLPGQNVKELLERSKQVLLNFMEG